ncbi:MAG: hypothetical protein AAB091_01995, partial [Elusimicrobiota bacterium]
MIETSHRFSFSMPLLKFRITLGVVKSPVIGWAGGSRAEEKAGSQAGQDAHAHAHGRGNWGSR